MVYVEDVDAVFAAAVDAGQQLRPVEDQFYGDRLGAFEDPFGHHWNVATRTSRTSAPRRWRSAPRRRWPASTRLSRRR